MDKRFQILPDIYKQITNEIHDIIVRDNKRNVLGLLKGKWVFALSFTKVPRIVYLIFFFMYM